jgi:hypothetical protein
MTGTFTTTEWLVMLAIFLTSGAYWIILDMWAERDADSYDANTWFLVVVGVAYVLLWLRVIVPPEMWWRVFAAFASASVLIVTRSLVINIRRNQRTKEFFQKRRDDE